MADNVELDAGSGGATVAADDIAGVHHQRVKISLGADGSATDALGGAGAVAAGVQRVTLASDDPAVALLGTMDADTGGILTAAQVMDDWDESDRAKVNIIVGQAGVAAGAGSVGATVPRVTLASDDPGVAALEDIKAAVEGTLTVGSHAVTNAGTFAVQVSSIAAGDNNIGNVDIVSLPASTNTIEVVGDAAENAAAAGNPVLTGGRYDSTPRTLGNGDVGALALNASGQVLVEIAAGAGSGGTAAADDADFTAGTTSGTPVMGVYESSPTSVTDGDLGTVGITSTRALKVAIASGGVAGIAEDSASAGGEEGIMMLAVRRDSASSGVSADGDFAALSVTSDGSLRVSGSSGTTQYTEDGASAGGESLCLAGTVRRDTAASSAGTDGDYATLNTDANGRLHVLDGNSGAALTALQIMDDWDESDRAKVNIVAGQAGITAGAGAVGASTPRVTLASDDPAVALLTTIDADTGNLGASLTALQLIDNPIVAHDAAASGSSGVNMAGGYATNSIEGLTQVAAADASRIVTDLNGVQVTRPHTTLEELISERVSNTDGSSTAFTNFAAGGSGVHNYVTQVSIWNSSSTDGYVDFRDGTGGTVKWTFPAPQTGGCTVSFDPPLKFADNTAVAYDVSGAISTVYISVNGFQAQG